MPYRSDWQLKVRMGLDLRSEVQALVRRRRQSINRLVASLLERELGEADSSGSPLPSENVIREMRSSSPLSRSSSCKRHRCLAGPRFRGGSLPMRPRRQLPVWRPSLLSFGNTRLSKPPSPSRTASGPVIRRGKGPDGSRSHVARRRHAGNSSEGQAKVEPEELAPEILQVIEIVAEILLDQRRRQQMSAAGDLEAV